MDLIAVPCYQRWVILECGHLLHRSLMGSGRPVQPCFDCDMRRGAQGMGFPRCLIWMEGGPWN